MDIHRCRFVPYQPSAINALAFSHTSGSTSRDQPLRLALGRENGDIEIWDPCKGAWVHELTMRGGRGRSIAGLAWTQDPNEEDGETGYTTQGRLRLFSIGYSSTVTEWDLLRALPLRHSSASHSEVWSLAAQPRWKASRTAETSTAPPTGAEDYLGQNLVVGCSDGSLVLLTTADDSLAYSKYISRPQKKKARALSLVFQSRDVVVAGFADSSIRVYNIRTSNLLRTMSLGAGPQGGPKETLVWALECLRDGTIVSGDSNGHVCFWDAHNYAQLQKIKSHEADTLCLTASDDGGTLFSGGIDRRTCVYSLSADDHGRRRWAKRAHRRFHEHDIKAMARFENKNMSIVVSGGLDTEPIITPLREFGKEFQRKLPHTPQTSPILASSRYLVGWWEREVSIWMLGNQTGLHADMLETLPQFKLMSKMMIKGDESITSASLTKAGDLLAVATSAETKFFQLRRKQVGLDDMLKVKKLDLPLPLKDNGARLVCFSPDGQWLLHVSPHNKMKVFRIVKEQDPIILAGALSLQPLSRPRTKQNALNGDWGSYSRIVIKITFSDDSRTIAAADLAGNIDTWSLHNAEDRTISNVSPSRASEAANSSSSSSSSDEDEVTSEAETSAKSIYGHSWLRNPHTLPKLPTFPLILTFKPAPTSKSPAPTQPTLFCLTSTHEIFEYNLTTGSLTDWSRRNPTSSLPDEFQLIRDRAVGHVWDTSEHAGARIWLYGASWLFMLNLSQDLPRKAPTIPLIKGAPNVDINADALQKQEANSRKRKRQHKHRDVAELQAQRDSKRGTSGAGSKMPDEELAGGKSRRAISKVAPDGTREEVNFDELAEARRRRRRNKSAEDGDGDVDEDETESEEENENEQDGTQLAALRRAGTLDEREGSVDGMEFEEYNKLASGDKQYKAELPYWLTMKYRPILGLVALGKEEEPEQEDVSDRGNDNGTGKGTGTGRGKARREPLEVALIERPFWDLDLPPRFHGKQEWER